MCWSVGLRIVVDAIQMHVCLLLRRLAWWWVFEKSQHSDDNESESFLSLDRVCWDWRAFRISKHSEFQHLLAGEKQRMKRWRKKGKREIREGWWHRVHRSKRGRSEEAEFEKGEVFIGCSDTKVTLIRIGKRRGTQVVKTWGGSRKCRNRVDRSFIQICWGY